VDSSALNTSGSLQAAIFAGAESQKFFQKKEPTHAVVLGVTCGAAAALHRAPVPGPGQGFGLGLGNCPAPAPLELQATRYALGASLGD